MRSLLSSSIAVAIVLVLGCCGQKSASDTGGNTDKPRTEAPKHDAPDQDRIDSLKQEKLKDKQ